MVEGYPDSLGGWSAPAIFKEGGRLIGKYIALLYPFILAFYLPAVVIQFLEILGVSWLFTHHKHHPHPHPHPHHHHFPGHFPHHHHHHHFGSFQSFFVSNKVLLSSFLYFPFEILVQSLHQAQPMHSAELQLKISSHKHQTIRICYVISCTGVDLCTLFFSEIFQKQHEIVTNVKENCL